MLEGDLTSNCCSATLETGIGEVSEEMLDRIERNFGLPRSSFDTEFAYVIDIRSEHETINMPGMSLTTIEWYVLDDSLFAERPPEGAMVMFEPWSSGTPTLPVSGVVTMEDGLAVSIPNGARTFDISKQSYHIGQSWSTASLSADFDTNTVDGRIGDNAGAVHISFSGPIAGAEASGTAVAHVGLLGIEAGATGPFDLTFFTGTAIDSTQPDKDLWATGNISLVDGQGDRAAFIFAVAEGG